MFRLNEPGPDTAKDPAAYERSICEPRGAGASRPFRDPGTFEIARVDGRSITIPYARINSPSGELALVEILVPATVLNSYYQVGEVASFIAEVSAALISAGIAKEA